MELLSPAGNPESFRAALESGADAIYMGLPWFNARRPAQNFTPESMRESLEEAHKRGVKVYVTINTDIKPTEIEDAAKVLTLLEELKVDAVIIKDFGLFYLAREKFPGLELHLSTQFGIANSYAAEMAKRLGASRVIPARELSFDELNSMKSSGRDLPEIEAFVQGSMCFSFSGRCLLSSWVGGKSANRGVCQAPCRLKYQSGDSEFPFFSMKDLNLVNHLEKLDKADISSLKIEGRLKSPGWVGSITSIYRSALSGEKTGDSSTKELLKYSGREMGEGFTTGLNHLTSENRAKFGNYLGKVKSITDNYLILDINEKSVDTSLRFVTESDEFLNIIHPESIELEKLETGEYKMEATGREQVGALVYEVKPSRKSNSGIGKMRYDVELELIDTDIEVSVYNDDGVFREREPYKKVVKAKRGVYPDQIYDKLIDKVVNGWRFNKLYAEDILLSKTQVNSIVKIVSYILAVTIQESNPLNRVELNSGVTDFLKPLEDGKDLKEESWIRIEASSLMQSPGKNIIIEELTFNTNLLDRVISYSRQQSVMISLFPINFEEDINEIREIVTYLENHTSLSYEINDIGHYNLLRYGLNIDTERLVAGHGMAVYNHLAIKFMQEVLGIDRVTIPMEMDSRGVLKLVELNNSMAKLRFHSLSRVPVMFSRAQSEDFYEGAEFVDKIGTVFYVHKFKEINTFYAKEFFSSEGCRDLDGIKFSENIKESYCLDHPETETKYFNLQRRLY